MTGPGGLVRGLGMSCSSSRFRSPWCRQWRERYSGPTAAGGDLTTVLAWAELGDRVRDARFTASQDGLHRMRAS